MGHTRAVVVSAVLLVAGAGCRSADASRPAIPPAAPQPATVADEFERLCRDHGSITFRSWNGRTLRMDSDTELTFYPAGRAHMFE